MAVCVDQHQFIKAAYKISFSIGSINIEFVIRFYKALRFLQEDYEF